MRRIDVKFIKVKVIQALIQAGCFDHLYHNRKELLANSQEIIENVQLTGQNLALSESLGGVPMKEIPEATKGELAEMENEVLGFSTMTSPLVAAQKYAEQFNARSLSDFAINDTGIAVGKLMTLKLIRTKKAARWLLPVLRIQPVGRKL